MKKSGLIAQFKITLLGVTPRVWRRIQVPADYTFWDLHVAIQDSMGWLDYHLHVFHFQLDGKTIDVGLPMEEDEQNPSFFSGWDVKLDEYFLRPGFVSRYEYDFGDGWQHDILFEKTLPARLGVRYPRCIAGRRPCPPEDCGGVGGYAKLLRILRNPKHEEYQHMVSWMREMEGLSNRPPFDERNPAGVRFDEPRKRLRIVQSHSR